MVSMVGWGREGRSRGRWGGVWWAGVGWGGLGRGWGWVGWGGVEWCEGVIGGVRGCDGCGVGWCLGGGGWWTKKRIRLQAVLAPPPNDSIWKEVDKQMASICDCSTATSGNWFPDSDGLLALTLRVHAIAKLLLEIPGTIAVDGAPPCDVDVVSLKVSVQSGMDLPEVAEKVLPADFLKSFYGFRDKQYIPKAKDVMATLSSASDAKATEVFARLLLNLNEIFGEATPIVEVDLKSPLSLQKFAEWSLDHAYCKELTDFARSSQDDALKSQLHFVFMVQKAVVPLARAMVFWAGTEKATEQETFDAQMITQASFNLMKDVRIEVPPLQRCTVPDEKERLAELFVVRDHSVRVLAGRFKAVIGSPSGRGTKLLRYGESGGSSGSNGIVLVLPPMSGGSTTIIPFEVVSIPQ